MIIDDVHRGIHKNKTRKRIGRGPGSGHGKTSGRGHKGYFSRSGSSRRLSFEGGQTPLAMRVAKRGFNNAAFATEVSVVNLSGLEANFESGETVTVAALAEKGLVRKRAKVVKILGKGKLSKSLTVKVHRISKSAEAQVTEAGGTVELVVG